MEKIKRIKARQVFDSRGNPTVQAEVILSGGARGTAMVPSGASTGRFEALEIRDGGVAYGGKGVHKAVENVNGPIAALLVGVSVADLTALDIAIIEADGTEDKSRFGANAMLGVSLAAARAAAACADVPLYQYLSTGVPAQMPVPMMNVLNGGAHANNNLDIQEFMIMPVGAGSFAEGMRWCTEVYHTLAALLHSKGFSTAVGDEGGFAPDLESDEKALEFLMRAIEKAGYRPEEDFVLAIDAAASEWAQPDGRYVLPKSGKNFSSEALIAYWVELAARYPLKSLEDGLGENDWAGWHKLTQVLGQELQLVGDDLFVTNPRRLQKGIEMGCANAILIKPNQIGTLSETLQAIAMAQEAGFNPIISHRSGETEDTTIADLAVATGAGQIKSGAPARSERVAKYNRLLEIEESLGEAAHWPGKTIFSAS